MEVAFDAGFVDPRGVCGRPVAREVLPNSDALTGESGREPVRECWGVEIRARFRPGKV